MLQCSIVAYRKRIFYSQVLGTASKETGVLKQVRRTFLVLQRKYDFLFFDRFGILSRVN